MIEVKSDTEKRKFGEKVWLNVGIRGSEKTSLEWKRNTRLPPLMSNLPHKGQQRKDSKVKLWYIYTLSRSVWSFDASSVLDIRELEHLSIELFCCTMYYSMIRQSSKIRKVRLLQFSSYPTLPCKSALPLPCAARFWKAFKKCPETIFSNMKEDPWESRWFAFRLEARILKRENRELDIACLKI